MGGNNIFDIKAVGNNIKRGGILKIWGRKPRLENGGGKRISSFRQLYTPL